MKYKELVIRKLEELENKVSVARGGKRHLTEEEEVRAWETIGEKIEDIRTLINQNHEE